MVRVAAVEEAFHSTADMVLQSTQALQILLSRTLLTQGDNIMDPRYPQEPTSPFHLSIVMCDVPTRDFQKMTC